MLRLNNDGIISWLLSQLALLLAAAILIASIASITFYNDWQKEAEAKRLALNLASEIASMDLKTYPNSTLYWIDSKKASIYLSTEYVRVIRYDGNIHKKLFATATLLVKPFIYNGSVGWRNGDDLYSSLCQKFCKNGDSSKMGDAENPFSYDEKPEVENYIASELNRISKELAIRPLRIDPNRPLYIEKAYIYFKKDDGTLDRIGVLIVSQVKT